MVISTAIIATASCTTVWPGACGVTSRIHGTVQAVRYDFAMTSARCTPADLEFCEMTGTRPRQLQEWRRLGLVDHEVRSLGRGLGRVSQLSHRTPSTRFARSRDSSLCGESSTSSPRSFRSGVDPEGKGVPKGLCQVVRSEVKAGIARWLRVTRSRRPLATGCGTGRRRLPARRPEVAQKLRDLTRTPGRGADRCGQATAEEPASPTRPRKPRG